jgi:lipopolysaccharide/colanic/teichoic acid biosynthesis glycosyltransferase
VRAKRLFDLSVAAALLLVTAPLQALVAILVRAVLGRPVLFRQVRPGLHGRPFTMYKFRTMREARGEDGELRPDAERLGRFGRFLRSTSLDELPGLFNVLAGEMSLVGPRPLLMEYLPLYTPRQARRHEVPPGLTGWAQIHGRNRVDWEARFELDVWYVENRTFWLDLAILWRTLGAVLRREDVQHPGHVSMERFRGSS